MKNMIYLVAIFLIFTISAFGLPINECKIDIYFGNGVWNKEFSKDCETDSSADCSRQELNDLIQEEIIKNDPKLKAKYGKVLLAYNWGQGWDIDLVETFYQLKEAGQLSEWAFFALMDALITNKAADLYGEDVETMREKFLEAITKNEQANVDQMLQNYYDKSFSLGHRVLLVSHSQGNLFANRVYDNIDPSGYKEYFANVQVASPASSVHAQKGDYITGRIDPIINPIPGSMKSNAKLDSPGHSFVGAYLGSKDTYTKIVSAIKAQLELLDNTPSQWKITNTPFDRSSCETIRAKVKHKFDPNIEEIENVFPFKTKEYKLYPLPSGEYVLAKCGGEKIEKEWNDKKFDECYLLAPNGSVITFDPEVTFLHGHNLSAFLPEGLGAPVGYIDNSTGCATIHVPQGYITFYKLKSGYTSCVPEFTFGYASGQIYTCLPASYFQLIGSISVEKFLQQARYQGKRSFCGGTFPYFTQKDQK